MEDVITTPAAPDEVRDPTRTRLLVRRTVLALAAVLMGVTLVLVALWGTQAVFGVRGAVLSYGNITESSIDVTFEVNRDPELAVECDLAAVGDGGFDVGAARVQVPPGEPRRAVRSTTIATSQPPLAARLVTCRESSTG
jgi:hypothetical protein